MTLRRRLTVAFLAIVLGPILVSATAVGGLATKWTHDAEQEELRNGGNAITTAVASLCQRARTVAQSISLVTGQAERLPADDRMIAGMVQNGTIDAARIADPAGRTVAARGAVSDELLTSPWADCRNGDGSAQLIAATLPITNAVGNNLGTVQSGFVIDEQLVRELRGVSGLDVAVRLGGEKLGELSARGQRVRELQPSAGQPLRIEMATPRHDLRGLYVTLVLITLLVAAVAVLAARMLAGTLTRPLAELARAADEVGIGNLATRVPVRGVDETATVARAFNRMLKDLEKYVTALRSSRNQLRSHLSSLGQALSSRRDMDAIMELTLQTAMAATGANSGIVLLTSSGRLASDPPVLVGRYGRGLSNSTPVNELRLPFGEGLLGSVAASGAPRRGHVEEANVQLAESEPHCTTFIAVPFLPAGHSGEPLGVLALYDRLGAGMGADDFDDSDLETLQSFAAQAAGALVPVER